MGAILLALCGTVAAQSASPPSRPAEESRLPVSIFREALRARGLTELLELHLRDFPPSSETEALLALRDVKLAAFADARRTRGERQAAIAEANELLEEAIRLNSESLSRFEWRYELARSLLYDEAEPFFSRVVYFGGGASERATLLTLTERALETLHALNESLNAEYNRLDELTVGAYEQLERSGYVERIDQLAPRVEYLLLWAALYDVVPRKDDDPRRAKRLHDILMALKANPALLSTPHDASRVQAQTSLLAGMTHRRLHDAAAAREHLDRALAIGERADAAERLRLGWVFALARLERIRTDIDAERFEDAADGLARWRKVIAGEATSDGASDGVLLGTAAALLERDALRARSAAAEREGRSAEAQRYGAEAWQVLARFAEAPGPARDSAYAIVYSLIGADADPAALDPFERCAWIAGRLRDADGERGAADDRLAAAVAAADRYFDSPGDAAVRALAPHALYNAAVASYRRGQAAEAARRFLDVSRRFPGVEFAARAGVYAVELAAALYGDESFRGRADVEALYLASLQHLAASDRDTEAGRYWRFFYGQLLEERGDFDHAAAVYARVDEGHAHYHESLYRRVRCLTEGLVRQATDSTEEVLAARRRTADFLGAFVEVSAVLSGAAAGEADPKKAAALRHLLARTRLAAAEAMATPTVDRAGQALEVLAGFEELYPGESGELGRVWRTRIVALERLGRLDEAAEALPAYVAADPAGSGPTLQALYAALAAEAERLDSAGEEAAALSKAEAALMLCEQIDALARAHDKPLSPDRRRALAVQLGEANLRARRYPRARELFRSVSDDEHAALESGAGRRALFGLAEASYRQQRYAEALPSFNRLAVRLPAEDPLRWRALLRDLQCRTSLRESPGDILQVIRQQRFLHPTLGGDEIAAALARLERENQRRLDSGEGRK